jgi:hypothetical protein
MKAMKFRSDSRAETDGRKIEVRSQRRSSEVPEEHGSFKLWVEERISTA